MFRSEKGFLVMGLFMSHARMKERSLGNAIPVSIGGCVSIGSLFLTSRHLPSKNCFVRKSPGSDSSGSML